MSQYFAATECDFPTSLAQCGAQLGPTSNLIETLHPSRFPSQHLLPFPHGIPPVLTFKRKRTHTELRRFTSQTLTSRDAQLRFQHRRPMKWERYPPLSREASTPTHEFVQLGKRIRSSGMMRLLRACWGVCLFLVVGTGGFGVAHTREDRKLDPIEAGIAAKAARFAETSNPIAAKAARVADVRAIWAQTPEVPSPVENVQGCKLAIVGAGYGGLYFAYRLVFDEAMVSASDLCIFEASARRVGGRVYSLRNLLGDPELVLDVGAYRYVPTQKLITKLIEDRLGLNTRCYYPLTCRDSRRIVVDKSGLNHAGYVTPVETMLNKLVEAGARVYYGYKLTGVFDLSTDNVGSVRGKQPVKLSFKNNGSAVVEQVMLNVPSEAIRRLDGRSILFHKQTKCAQGGYMTPVSVPAAKVYVEYADAWWMTKLGLMEGRFNKLFDLGFEGRYHDGPIRCFDKDSNQIPLTSKKEDIHKCNGALLVFYDVCDSVCEHYYTRFTKEDDPLSIFKWDESSYGFELIKGVHKRLMEFHSENFTSAGISPADIDPPLYLYVGNWNMEKGLTGSVHDWAMYLPGTTIAKTTRALMRPVPGYDIFIANEAFGIYPGWAEGSVVMAERVLAYELGVGKPAWLNEDKYYEDVVMNLDFFDILTVQLFGATLPHSDIHS